MCWSQEASTCQHKESFVGGTIGAFRLCSDRRLIQWQTYTEHSEPTPCPFLVALRRTAGTTTQLPNPLKHTAVLLPPTPPPSVLVRTNALNFSTLSAPLVNLCQW